MLVFSRDGLYGEFLVDLLVARSLILTNESRMTRTIIRKNITAQSCGIGIKLTAVG